jgi:class 3 adenylate cyclase/pimeloyl-ACP methyl ester carboxylesterase
MAEPQIQYAKTSDGVSIAFATLGEGMPFVHMPFAFPHLQLNWETPEFRSWYERLAKGRQFVTYDVRASGLSDRDVTDFSLDAGVRDLEAVVDRLSLERFALFAPSLRGLQGVAYAVRHPERVSHFILMNAGARTTDFTGGPQAQALLQLANADWEVFTETMAHVALGWSAGEQARRYAAIIRESITQETLLAVLAAPDIDVTELLPQVSSPTLVLHSRDTPIPSVDAARGLASRIPNARLVLLEGVSPPALGYSEAVHSAIDEFLGDEVPTTTPDAPGAFRTILFTDVEGSTALTDRLGDAKARDLLHEHERITREALKQHAGSEVKTMGDGFMASFGSATKALECAIAVQRAFAERNESAEEPIKVRIGLNAGEPIAEDDPGGRGDLFGTAVNMAARIAAKAAAGEILASNVVRELVAGKEFLFSDRGETELRGFEDPVRVYEVRWRESD